MKLARDEALAVNSSKDQFLAVLSHELRTPLTPDSGSVKLRSFNRNEALCVEVLDTGIGISPELLPRIFDPFEQGSNQYMRQFGGLGLGLAISKAAVEAHDGILSATSGGKDSGSAFCVELPLS